MEKVGVKTRDIQFYSEKGGVMVKVHSKPARDYAKWLEGEAWVESYEAACPWDLTRYPTSTASVSARPTLKRSGPLTSSSAMQMGGLESGSW